MAMSIKLLLNTKSIAATLVLRPHSPPSQMPIFELTILALIRDDGNVSFGSYNKIFNQNGSYPYFLL